MGRTVDSSPPASTSLLITAMKVVLLLVVLVLVQISYSQDSHEVSSNDAGDNLLRAEREANPRKQPGNKRNGKRRAAKGKKNNVKRKSNKSKRNGKTGPSKSKRNGKTGPSKKKQKGKKRNSAKKQKGKKRNSAKKKSGKRSKNKIAKHIKKKSGKNLSKKSKPKKPTKIQDISQKPRKDTRETDCLASAMGKAKKYIKFLNQLRKANRIKKSAEQMDSKKTKAATVFKDAADAIFSATSNGTDCEGGDLGDDVKTANEKLQKCNETAATKCDSVTIAGLNLPKIAECKPLLQAFIDEAKACIYVASPVCSCFDALPTVDEDKCAQFDTVDTKAVAARKKCTKNTEEGSFGFCRAKERLVGPFGNKCKRCSPRMTTKAPGSRQNLFARIQNRALLRHLGRN